MALEPCPECGHQVSTKAVACPSCGFDLKAEQVKKEEQWAALTKLGLWTVILVPIFVWFCSEDEPKSPEQLREEKERRTRAEEKMETEYACIAAVRARSLYKTKVEFGLWKVLKTASGYTMSGTVELLNSYGAMIPHTYYCYVSGSLVTDLKLFEGS